MNTHSRECPTNDWSAAFQPAEETLLLIVTLPLFQINSNFIGELAAVLARSTRFEEKLFRDAFYKLAFCFSLQNTHHWYIFSLF